MGNDSQIQANSLEQISLYEIHAEKKKLASKGFEYINCFQTDYKIKCIRCHDFKRIKPENIGNISKMYKITTKKSKILHNYINIAVCVLGI